MALYEYRCSTCESTFELRRPMSESNDPATCPHGHVGAKRMLSVFASVGAATAGSPGPSRGPSIGSSPSGGGCGGACACHG